MSVEKASEIDSLDIISSRLPISRAIGVGGLPKQRIVEVVGMPGAGKSTACMQEVANAQKQKEKCLWVDGEGSFTPLYAEALGVDTDALDVLRGESLEEILNEVLEHIHKETYDLIVIDSIGQLIPRAALEKAIGERIIGGQAYPIGQFVRRVAATEFAHHKHKICILGINQLTTDIMTGRVSGRGGESWNYHKSVSIVVKKKPGMVLKSGEKVIGYPVVFEVREKNKMIGNVGFKFDSNFINNEGFSASADLLANAIERGVFERTGNTFHFKGEKIGTMSKLRDWAKEHEEELKTALT